MTARRIAGLFLLVAIASAAAHRAEGARATFPDERLESLVSEALLKNPDVAAVLATSEAADLRVAPARTLPDPFLSFNYQNDGTAISLGRRDMTFLGGMLRAEPSPGRGNSGSPARRRGNGRRRSGRAPFCARGSRSRRECAARTTSACSRRRFSTLHRGPKPLLAGDLRARPGPLRRGIRRPAGRPAEPGRGPAPGRGAERTRPRRSLTAVRS